MSSPAYTQSYESVARDLASRIGAQLPDIILQLLQSGVNLTSDSLQLECSLSSLQDGVGRPATRLKVASVDLDSSVASQSPRSQHAGPADLSLLSRGTTGPSGDAVMPVRRSAPWQLTQDSRTATPIHDVDARPTKRRRVNGDSVERHAPTPAGSPLDGVSSQMETDGRTVSHKKKKPPDNPSMQPSTVDKFIGGVWDSIFSGIKLDPVDVVEQWQAIESNGQPRLLMETDYELANISEEKRGVIEGMFGRMNVLTRRISQTSRACRSLEVIVQAYWVHCFDGHVEQLAASMPRDKAKKTAISQACIDFNWSEKELRNKMGIWRGYHDIRQHGGWAALVFAGMGLYRFCKYRVSFNEETFGTLRALRHRWELAADTLHPRWRQLLGIIGGPTERKYTGHSHDWVVGSTFDEAIPLAPTYYQWDPEFSYTHLEESIVDEDVWGDFDPRDVDFHSGMEEKFKCATCGEQQSHDPKLNTCTCFPNLYGGTKARMMPVQVFRTPNGKNNGLVACAAFEEGAAIGEFIGQITAGLSGTDVMIGQTERATYQISQRRQGNHLRFVNHSCQPNSQYERFSWLGKQRIVLVSKGVEAGQEITVDYSDTYWRNLDKVCLCGQPGCRYKDRDRRLLAASEST
ncbi:hypothetical protein D0869_11794 [Hortaea werneckii]|uniref:SET domain-containing protein n=1 Tax=Hortaea werneckii TaxID=91943 RepID=A0A3M6W9R8_HORWE|nr:hypothetical protein D0869_11794 [Hortaea werneckii]RMY16720.1 hypothetical protein D0868_00144 [Hortaea werneckii]RMY34990.1 hypothetical protein D0866_04902 [Hortaea werneckii]